MTNLTAKLDQLVLLAATHAPGSQTPADVTVLAREVAANPELSADPAQAVRLGSVITRTTRQLEAGATELDLSGPRTSIVGEVRAAIAHRFPGH